MLYNIFKRLHRSDTHRSLLSYGGGCNYALWDVKFSTRWKDLGTFTIWPFHDILGRKLAVITCR